MKKVGHGIRWVNTRIGDYLLGQMASKFNADYGYEKNPNKTTDYQVTVIDFDENFRKRSTQYI